MSERRFIWKCDDENCQIYDTKEKKAFFNVEVVDLLNTQQSTITELERKLKKYTKIGEEQLKQIIELQEEIKRLEKMIWKIQWRFQQEVGIEKAREHYQEIDKEMEE